MITVLIVDDEKIERDYLSSIISKKSSQYSVVGLAENGEQAVTLALTVKPDIIIMDINLPLLSGLEASKEIRKYIPDQIIILNSAYSEFEFAQKAISEQLDAYLLKPTQEDVIFSTIQASYNRKTLMNNILPRAKKNKEIEYPYNAIKEIISAISENDFSNFKENSEIFINFLNNKKGFPNEYYPYIINTTFSIEQALYHSNLSEDFLYILDNNSIFNKIYYFNNSWEDIKIIFMDFFNKILLLVKSDIQEENNSVQIVVNYINENYSEDLSLEVLTSVAHFSQSHLSRLFKKQMGMTISQYINLKRIEKAVFLLKNTSKSLKNIASECGFVNISHFHRVFKNIQKKTPMEIRKEK